MKESYSFFLPALMIGAALLVAGLISVGESVVLMARGGEAVGTFSVAEHDIIIPPKKDARTGPETIATFRREVRFRVDDLEYVIEPFVGPFPCRLEQDESVQVFYSRADPWTARARIFSDLWGRGLLMSLGGSALTAFGIVRFRRKWITRQGYRQQYLGW